MTGAARGEAADRLEHAVGALPDDERQVVLLRFFQGLPLDEIARVTATPETTVRRRLGRAVAALGVDLGGCMTPPTDDDEADRLGRLADEVAAGAKGVEPLEGSEGGVGDVGGEGGEGAEPVPEASAVDDAARATAAALLGAGLSEAAIDEALDAAFEARPRLPVPVPPGYDLLEEIGRGGGGVVYRARQVALDREVAIKVLHPGDGLFDAAIRRFEREARALARVRHPGIVAVHEVGSTGGRLWYAMDLVEGTSLADELAEGPYAPEDGARLVRDVADAVAAVHGHGLVHRDLKPANVLLDADGRPYVGDFGLALELGGGADDLTLTGQVIGTPAYMAPEQAKGEGASAGPATDVYALGAILYEVLGGRRPFAGLSPPEQVYAAIHRDPTPLRRVRRGRARGPRAHRGQGDAQAADGSLPDGPRARRGPRPLPRGGAGARVARTRSAARGAAQAARGAARVGGGRGSRLRRPRPASVARRADVDRERARRGRR